MIKMIGAKLPQVFLFYHLTHLILPMKIILLLLFQLNNGKTKFIMH